MLFNSQDVINWASKTSIDELTDGISQLKEQVKLLEHIKKLRIKQGEKTSKMIAREQKKSAKKTSVENRAPQA